MKTDRALCIALFLLLSSIYFSTVSGITCSNDGSHYALTRALAEEGRFSIESYDEYAEGNDIAVREDRLFSDRPPGTALIASAFYEIGNQLPSPLAQLPSRHNPGNPRLLYVMLVPVWAGAGTVMLLYLLLRELGTSIFTALTTSVMFGLGTTHWKYSSVLFSHAPSALLVMLSVYIAIRLGRAPKPHWTSSFALGLTVGYAVLVEYSNALLVAAVAAYSLLTPKSRSTAAKLQHTALFIGGGLLPAGFLAFYNLSSFGSPFALSYDYAINYPWAGKLRETFSFPIIEGLRALLFWGEGGGWCNPTCYNQGLFLLSPVLLLSTLGIVPLLHRARRESTLMLGLFLVCLGLFAKHRTFHGFTADGRYLTPFLALWCVPLAFYVESLVAWSKRPAWQAVAYLVLYAAFYLSVRNILLHIGFSYNYEMDLGQLSPMIARPGNWAYLFGQVFRNVRNLPLLWLPEGVILVLWLGMEWAVRRCTNHS
jgi:hypothetical protein